MQSQNHAPKVILHATDLRPDGGAAFEHSVALARDLSARLVSVHAAKADVETRPMPVASELLEGWGFSLDEFDHETIEHICCEDPVDTLLDVLSSVEHDLVVVGSHQRKGVDRLVSGSVSESVILNSHSPVLVVPVGKRGFVRAGSGEMKLQSVVVPARSNEELEAVERVLLETLPGAKENHLDVYVLTVGEAAGVDAGQLERAQSSHWTWHVLYRNGNLVDAICEAVDEVGADLLAMATEGQDSLFDTVVGTNTLRAMRLSEVPLLVVPF